MSLVTQEKLNRDLGVVKMKMEYLRERLVEIGENIVDIFYSD